jgi:hypothetical protein
MLGDEKPPRYSNEYKSQGYKSPSPALLNNILDLQNKMRELELQLIDLKGSQERRLTAMNEQFSSKIDRSIQSYEHKTVSLQSQHNSNFQVAADQFQTWRNQLASQINTISDRVSLLSSKHEEFDLKLGSVQRTVQNAQEFNAIGGPNHQQ